MEIRLASHLACTLLLLTAFATPAGAAGFDWPRVMELVAERLGGADAALGSGVSSPNFFKRTGNDVNFLNSNWQHGSETDRLLYGWYQNFNVTRSSTTAATTTSLAIGGIATGNCLQTGTGGVVTGTGSACGAGGGGPAGQNGAWEAFGTAALTPTSTSRGILVHASSTIQSGLAVDGDATSTGRLTVGTTQPVNNAGGDLYVGGDATTTAADVNNLRIRGTTGSTQCLQIDTNGNVSGTGSACGAGGGAAGQNGAWEALGTTALTPTSTTRGIMVTASSTIAAGATTTRSLSVGSSVGANSLDFAAGDLWVADDAEIASELFAAIARLAMLNATTTNIGTLTVLTGSVFPANDIVDAEVSNTLTASTFAANPANCSAGNYPLGIDATGAVESCTADANTTGQNGAWQAVGSSALSPTSTSRGILVEGASSTVRSLVADGNATTTGYFVIGTTQPVNSGVGDLFAGGDATSTAADFNALRVRGITGSTQCLQIDTNGNVTGTGSACGSGGGGGNGAWEKSATVSNALTPTSTTNGIFVTASSTISAGGFRVDGNATTSGSYVVGADGATGTSTAQIGDNPSAGTGGGCLVIEDNDDAGFTYCTANNGTLTCNTTSCL